MRRFKPLAAVSSLLFSFSPASVFAQESGMATLEEIVVSGRKREETLQDIPVSASVISNTLIEDAGIDDLYDLFEMVPGLHYDEDGDRLAALPSIRGIQANDVAPNRTKVSAFVDGIPVLGNQGTIGFNGFQQVEVYRGPQSAAFGRSTFAGAINYVTRDPGDNLEGDVGVNLSDFGNRTVSLNLGGPITDQFGFLLSYQHEDSETPNSYHGTGDYGTDLFGLGQNQYQSDGTKLGSRTGDNLSAKFVFEPSDDLKVSMTFAHTETHDLSNPTFYLTEEARNACLEKGALFASEGMMAPYLVGEMDCDWDNVRQTFVNHDPLGFLQANDDFLNYLVTSAEAGVNDMGMIIPNTAAAPYDVDGDGDLESVEEQILLMAQAFTIPESEVGSQSERQRVTFQVDKLLENGSAVQFSFMKGEEDYLRAQANASLYYYDPDLIGVVDDGNAETFGDMTAGPQILWGQVDAMLLAPGESDPAGLHWYVPAGMQYPTYAQPSEGTIEEQYAELRWVSPAEDRLRYVVGASYYDYEFSEERWGNFDDMGNNPNYRAVSYAAQLQGIVDEFMSLSGHDDRGTAYAADNEVLQDIAENKAVYFNVGYDLTDKITLSAEGRFQSDTVSATNITTGISEEVTTETFVPRVSVTYDVNDNTSYYFQLAQGVNPRGINNAILTTDTLNVLENGIVNGLIPYVAGGPLDVDLVDNDFDPTVNLVDGPDGISDAYDSDTGLWYTDGTQTTLLTSGVYDAGFDRTDLTAYDEEKINQIEFGFKGTAFDGRLTYAGAVYHILWEDQLQNGSIDLDSPCSENGDAGRILNVVDPVTPANGITEPCTFDGGEYYYVSGTTGSNLNASLNFGDVEISGIELEGTYRINDNWNIRAQASLMDAKYDEFCDISAYNATEFDPNDTALPGGDAAYLDEFNIRIREPGENDTLTSTCYVTDGNEVANQPRFSGSISPSFSTDIAGMRLNARLDVRHEGEQWENSINYNYYPAATTANFSLGLSGDQWSATFYVNNLTDLNTPTRIRGGGDNSRQMGLIGQDDTYEFTGYLGETITNAQITRDNFNFTPRVPRTIGLRANYRF